jgi:ribosomal protein S18 acetylase RimI-like enzyme
MLSKDEWLSGYFDHGAYRLQSPYEAKELPKGFIFAKLPVSEIGVANTLLAQGFNLVEVCGHFVQKQNNYNNTKDVSDCREARPDDKTQVLAIAKHAFKYSRFYQDESINIEQANRVKHDWVENFFHGKRGTKLIVYTQANKIAGFLLLINNIIDLIAVAPDALRQGIGSKMIAFANLEVGLLSAGTQLINLASIQMYQKSGFCLENSSVVLHKHKV